MSIIQNQSNIERKSLWPIYHTVSGLEYVDPTRARQLLDAIWKEGLDNYTAPPDLWHNISMVAARVQHQEVELDLIRSGLREWSDNVDLLCDELQLCHSSHYNPARAKEIWNQLNAMDRAKTSPYWRFWVYGAIYHATELDDRKTALALLDEGLRSVKRDALMDILRNYRRVLVDSAPESLLEDEERVKEYQHQVVETLERRYKLGVDLGVENAYVLATDLAQLYQEQAGKIPNNISVQDTLTTSVATELSENYYLNQSWNYLNLAERLYTGSPNHPIWDIYEARIRILMAQRKCGDALKFLSSLPQARFNRNPSLHSMLKLASLITGEKIPELVNIASQEGLEQMLNKVFENSGALLLEAVQQNEPMRTVLKHVLEQLGETISTTEEITLEKAMERAIPFLFGDDGEGLLKMAQQNPAVRAILLNIVNQLQ